MFTCAKILKLIIYDICDVTLSVYPHWASSKNMPGHGWNRTYDLIYVSQRLFINLVVQRHACIVFLPNPPIAMFESRIGNFPKTLLLVSWEKIQYTRDGERPDL